MWSDFYRDGGWGMIPTTLFGFLLVASGVLWVIRPERRYGPLFASLGILTIGSGILGCVTGLIKTFRYVGDLPPAEQVGIAALGSAESLNNLVLAMLIAVFAGILASVAALRSLRASASRGSRDVG